MRRAKGPRAAGSLGMAMDAHLTLRELMSALGRKRTLALVRFERPHTEPYILRLEIPFGTARPCFMKCCMAIMRVLHALFPSSQHCDRKSTSECPLWAGRAVTNPLVGGSNPPRPTTFPDSA